MKKKPYQNKLDKRPYNNKKVKEVDIKPKTLTVTIHICTGRLMVVNDFTGVSKETYYDGDNKKATEFVDKCKAEWGIE